MNERVKRRFRLGLDAEAARTDVVAAFPDAVATRAPNPMSGNTYICTRKNPEGSTAGCIGIGETEADAWENAYAR